MNLEKIILENVCREYMRWKMYANSLALYCLKQLASINP